MSILFSEIKVYNKWQERKRYAINKNRLTFVDDSLDYYVTIPTKDIVETLKSLGFVLNNTTDFVIQGGSPINNEYLYTKLRNEYLYTKLRDVEKVYEGIIAENKLKGMENFYTGLCYVINITGEQIEGYNSKRLRRLKEDHYSISSKNGLFIFKNSRGEIFMGYNVQRLMERCTELGYKEKKYINMPDEKFYLVNEHLQGKLDLIKTIKEAEQARKKLGLADDECCEAYNFL